MNLRPGDLLGENIQIKVSKSFLEDDLRGVSVFSNGVWHETTLGGSEGREMSQYIFGEIDVPALDDDKSPVAPFNVSRSMQLNPENDLVRTIHAFIGSKVEEVRRSLVEADKKRKAEEDTKKLAEQASEIARVINEDFEAFRLRVAKVRAKTRGPNLNQDDQGGDDLGEDLIFGSDIPARETAPTGSPGRYGLRGSEVPPGLAESLVIERKKTRVLEDYGWTQDGKIYLTYKLSSGMLSNGIVTVPPGMKQHLSGTHELRVIEGVPIGQLVVKDSQAWGIGPLFKRRGGDPGDFLRILFDLKTKIAVAELGQASVDEEDEVNQRMVK